MKKITSIALMLAATALTTARATVYQFNFLGLAMDGNEEVPPNASPGNGIETGSGPGGNSFLFDTVSGNLTIDRVSFAGLQFPFAAATVNDAPPGVNGPEVLNLTAGTVTAPGGLSGTVNAAGAVNYALTAGQASELLLGNFYMEIRTRPNPQLNGTVVFGQAVAADGSVGEIRGQLVQVPEASTYAGIAFLGLVGAMTLRRHLVK